MGQSEPTLVEFVRYNQWANETLMALCEKIEGTLLTAPIQGAAGSILETFGHILRAEASFLMRIHGESPAPTFKWEEAPSLSQLRTYSKILGDAFLDTVQTVSPTTNVHEEEGDWIFDYQARLIFMSLVYHGIAHRTDITTFLNRQEIELPELDIWGYQDSFPSRFNAKLQNIADTSEK